MQWTFHFFGCFFVCLFLLRVHTCSLAGNSKSGSTLLGYVCKPIGMIDGMFCLNSYVPFAVSSWQPSLLFPLLSMHFTLFQLVGGKSGRICGKSIQLSQIKTKVYYFKWKYGCIPIKHTVSFILISVVKGGFYNRCMYILKSHGFLGTQTVSTNSQIFITALLQINRMKASVGMSTCTIISLSFDETHTSQCPIE